MIVNYVLQSEYAMGEFYSCATTGEGLPAAVRNGGTGPSSGCAMAALSTSVQARADATCVSVAARVPVNLMTCYHNLVAMQCVCHVQSSGS